jgi:hypothetical protein
LETLTSLTELTIRDNIHLNVSNIPRLPVVYPNLHMFNVSFLFFRVCDSC